jgi:hypothetical protein
VPIATQRRRCRDESGNCAKLLDGFKRQTAAALVSWPSLSVRLLEVDERRAKALIFGLNSVGRRPQEEPSPQR